VDKATGGLIGSIGIGQGEEPPVFYFLDPAFAGRGLAREMLAGFAREAFARFPVDALTAEAFDDNPASIRVLTRCGFAEVGSGLLTSAARAKPEPGTLFRLPRAA
jgi:RimJ/RimL family protein N-acetyltransferase